MKVWNLIEGVKETEDFGNNISFEITKYLKVIDLPSSCHWPHISKLRVMFYSVNFCFYNLSIWAIAYCRKSTFKINRFSQVHSGSAKIKEYRNIMSKTFAWQVLFYLPSICFNQMLFFIYQPPIFRKLHFHPRLLLTHLCVKIIIMNSMGKSLCLFAIQLAFSTMNRIPIIHE